MWFTEGQISKCLISHFLSPFDIFIFRDEDFHLWSHGRSGDLCSRKSSSYTELQWQWLLLDRQREPRSLFKFWHLKGPDTSQSLNISPGPGKFILTTELLCCLLTHVPDGFLFLVTEWLPRSRVHDWTFTLHFSTVYYAIH